MTEWTVREHPEFFSDLDKLGTGELRNFCRKKKKIKDNPERHKHLSGGTNCYREPITDNIRVIYYVEGSNIWFLTIGPHKEAYNKYIKRLHQLKKKLE